MAATEETQTVAVLVVLTEVTTHTEVELVWIGQQEGVIHDAPLAAAPWNRSRCPQDLEQQTTYRVAGLNSTPQTGHTVIGSGGRAGLTP